MRYRAVMLDLDGTLLDTLEDIARAADAALRSVGRPVLSRPEYKALIGNGGRWLLERALGPDHTHLVERALPILQQHYAAHADEHTTVYDGIPEMLDALVARGARLAVLTNKLDAVAQASVPRFFPRWKFDRVLGLRKGMPAKPDPTGALLVAEELDIPVSDWLYIGDTEVDVQTAAAAGMRAIGVGWGFREEAALKAAGASHVIDHPRDLVKVYAE